MRSVIAGYLLLIPLIYANKTTLSNDDHNKNKTTLSSKEESNLTQVNLISEGGSFLSNASDLTLPVDKYTLLDLPNDQTNKSKEHTISARKDAVLKEGVGLSNNVASIKNSTLNTTNVPLTSKVTVSTDKPTQVTQIPKVTKKVIHKPLHVSYEDIAQDQNDQLDMSQISSSNPSVPVQIPTPNYNGPKNNHPGMIMPIIITILVVPMFAILGYMALRRGQEAWKNRHYKRMDFLLDGMYNE